MQTLTTEDFEEQSVTAKDPAWEYLASIDSELATRKYEVAAFRAALTEGDKRLFVIIMSAGARRFGLVVESLMGEEELVMKALEDQLVSSELVSGASILGDGTVVLILNVSSLVARLAQGAPLGAIA